MSEPRPEKRAQTVLSEEETRAIQLRAEMRRKQQELKTNALNIEIIGATEPMKIYYERILQLVFREAKGEGELKCEQDQVGAKADEWLRKAKEETPAAFPNQAAYRAAEAAKHRLAAGEDPVEEIAETERFQELSAHIPKSTPSSLLPEAILLGARSKLAEQNPLPEAEQVAKAVVGDDQLLADYALVLPEKERAEFLKMIPEAQQQRVGRLLDVGAAEVLHQSLIERKSDEEKQRKEVRKRLFIELKEVVEEGEDDVQLTKVLAKAMGELGADMQQLMLEVIRDEFETRQAEGGGEKKDNLPRVIKVFLDEFEDWRGNDIVLRIAGDPNINHHLAIYLLGKLVNNKYIPESVQEWWDQGKKEKVPEESRLEALQRVITDLGVIPSREILEFLTDQKNWPAEAETLEARVGMIQESQAEFAEAQSSSELVALLNEDETKAMTYYLLYGGKDRFNLINNYSFEQFKGMLGLIDDLEIHPKPLEDFKGGLLKGGMSEPEADSVIERLKAGQYPLADAEQSYTEVSFDVSENAAVKNANAEIGRVLGSDQLGVVLRFPMYREYLEADSSAQAQALLAEMPGAKTFPDRLALLTRIEEAFPDMRDRVVNDLKSNWKIISDKMALELSLENILGQQEVPMRGEELIPRLDTKRLDLKMMKKDLIVALKGGNKRLRAIHKDISRKKKARKGLEKGLSKNPALAERIAAIDEQIAELERERETLSNKGVKERYAGMSDDEKEAELEKLSAEIIALTEKSPSAIFVYMAMQALGEERLNEQDVALVQEMESHLQGPFQTIVDSMTYQKPAGEGGEKKRMQVGLQYLDKQDRLMTMVRFADSKICCFSSSNYDMTVQHDTKNEFWVASINKDPLSFVISIELPSEKEGVKENIGFIFGSYALNEDGELETMFNGIYYAPGIEDDKQVEAIMQGVQRIFKGMPIKGEAIASQHGGSVKMPEGFTNEGVELTRLRAVDDGYGSPEDKIYDDLGTGSDLNKSHTYDTDVYHREIEY